MRICGIDPGLETTGYGVLDVSGKRATVAEAGTICPSERTELSIRIAQIFADLDDLLRKTRPTVVAVENLYSHYKHPQTAVLMGHVRGVVLLAAAKQGIEVREYAATRIKRCLTGNGRATKAQMQRAVSMQLGLSSPPEPDDVADALGVALCDCLSHNLVRISSVAALAYSGMTES